MLYALNVGINHRISKYSPQNMRRIGALFTAHWIFVIIWKDFGTLSKIFFTTINKISDHLKTSVAQ